MKKSLLAILVALVLGSGVVSADPQSQAGAVVAVNVVSNVAVGVVTGLVNLGNVQTGAFAGQIVFRVDANVQVVNLSVAVSNLYKDDAPTSTYFIPVYVPAGVPVVPEIGTVLPAGASNVLPYETTPISILGFAGLATISAPFGSGQNNHFSQNVSVFPAWIQADPELPTGEYSGLVVLTAVIGGTV
jgi:hypothetical protein